MIAHRTFARRHLFNMVGSQSLKDLEVMRRQAELFVKEHLRAEDVITIAETSDAYASTVTVWYRTGQ